MAGLLVLSSPPVAKGREISRVLRDHSAAFSQAVPSPSLCLHDPGVAAFVGVLGLANMSVKTPCCKNVSWPSSDQSKCVVESVWEGE